VDRPDILILADFLIEDIHGKVLNENSCSFLLELPVDLLCNSLLAIDFAVFDEGLEPGYMFIDCLLGHFKSLRIFHTRVR